MSIDLYRHFGKGNVLLYIGISGSTVRRTKEHKDNSKWWKDVVNITIEKFDSRKEAEGAEVEAIIEENPIHNIRRKYKEIRHRDRLKINAVKMYVEKVLNDSNIDKCDSLYDIPTVAKHLHMSQKYITELINAGILSHVEIPCCRRKEMKKLVTDSQINKYIKNLEKITEENCVVQ